MRHGDKQKRKILDAGLKLWRQDPARVTARSIADAVGLTHPTVLSHFKEAGGLRDAVAAHAVEKGDSRIIVQLMAQGHDAVKNLSDADRRRHAGVVVG
jgi:AcrR family transcriptional regulator